MPEDPGQTALRRATRAAIVIPPAFAFAKLVIGDLEVATFVSFGCFALLVMADYGGTRIPRAMAYIGTVLAGSALITVGTLASPIPWVGALVMLFVGLCIQFGGIFGSYIAASQTALLLSFVLSTSIPAASAGAVGPRLLGWTIAGVLSTLAGLFIWPHFERTQLRQMAADAARDLAAFLDSQRDPDRDSARPEERAKASVAALRRAYDAAPKRPAGPARRDRAFVELMIELERAIDIASRPFTLAASAVRPCLTESNALATAVGETLHAAANVLTGEASPDLAALENARLAHRRALDRWAAEGLQTATPPEEVLAGLDSDHALRVISYLALSIGVNATIVAGKDVEEMQLPPGTPQEGRARPLLRVARTVRTHVSPSSSALHQSLRTGVGLALAVLVTRVLRVDHGFWVVLGTLSVLRSNALGTGRTTLEALAGTVIGFAVGAIFTVAAGGGSTALWIALPIAVFLATYAASSIGFVVGQAAFTILVIVLFNLITPVGWRVGLVRIEDIALGVGISLAVGLLLWPRGARGELVVSLSGLYRAVAAYLAGSFARVLDPAVPPAVGVQRSLVVRAQDRAGEAFDQYLHERGQKPLDPETAGGLIAAGSNAIIVGDLLRSVAGMGYQLGDDGDEETTLTAQTQVMLAGFLHLADRLGGEVSALLPGARVSNAVLRDAALARLRIWRDHPDEGPSALAAVIAGEWLQQLGELTVELEQPVERAVEAARLPWWR